MYTCIHEYICACIQYTGIVMKRLSECHTQKQRRARAALPAEVRLPSLLLANGFGLELYRRRRLDPGK